MQPSFIADARADKGDEKKKRDYCVKTTTRHKMCECGAVSLYLPCRSKDSAGMVAACLTRDGT
jgi:hypothetical protein